MEKKTYPLDPRHFILLSICSVFIYALINSGGRGPILASVISICALYGALLWTHRDQMQRIGLHFMIFIFSIGLICLLANWFFNHTEVHSLQRFAPLLSGKSVDESVAERFLYYKSAFQAFLDHPLLGIGFGEWPHYYGITNIHIHPHNIFLEIAAETGLIGLSLFFMFVGSALYGIKIKTALKDTLSVSLLLILLFSFLNALKTGDVQDNLLFFITLSLITRWKSQASSRLSSSS